MASVASSSRVTLGRATCSAVPQSSLARRRNFGSSARVQNRLISITFAHRIATFQLPSFSSFFDALIPASVPHQPALAGIPSEFNLERSEEDQDTLGWDGILNAVPKSKVSHSRKAMRSANKGLKDRVDFVHCASCGQPKLAHHICASCFSVINRAHKAVKKDALRAEAKALTKKTYDVDIDTIISQNRKSIIITSKPKSQTSESAEAATSV